MNKNVHITWRTRKKSRVEPDPTNPYLILVCLAKSSADEMGESIRSTVKKAAKLAVYEEIMMSVKNHHNPATIRVDVALRQFKKISTVDYLVLYWVLRIGLYLGMTSLPCCIKDPMVNHMAFKIVKLFSNISGCCRHGWGLFHSYGVILRKDCTLISPMYVVMVT